MNKDFYGLITKIRNNWCDGCDAGECKTCSVKDVLKQVERLEGMYGNVVAVEPQDGCHICKKNKEIFYDNGRGGFPTATHCPNCGRAL